MAEQDYLGRAAMTKPAELYACLYAKEFPAQALLRLRPELRDKPCVVMEGEAPLEQACSLTRKARILGLMRGMTRVEVETFPAVTLLKRSQNEEATARTVLLECAGGFSPRVEDKSEDGAFLGVIDIAGTGTLFGTPDLLAGNLLARVRSLGITACVAVSRNFHAAIALAKGLPPRTPVGIIPMGEETATLSSLPLKVLDTRYDRRTSKYLWSVGYQKFRSVGSFARKGIGRPNGAGRQAPSSVGKGGIIAFVSAGRICVHSGRAHGVGLAGRIIRCTPLCYERNARTAHPPCKESFSCPGLGQRYVEARRWQDAFAHSSAIPPGQ
jgi:hypothetical protein